MPPMQNTFDDIRDKATFFDSKIWMAETFVRSFAALGTCGVSFLGPGKFSFEHVCQIST